MKIYLAGKITGDPEYRAKFLRYEEQLQGEGHIVLNPATAPEGLRPVDYMRLCFAMMEAADVVLFMQDYQDSRGAMMSIADCVAFIPDWEESHGAQVEYAWCKYVGKPMMGLRGEAR